MYLLTVTLYEFGQFLQILLWIFIPMFVITALVTTYIHYRRKKRQDEEDGSSLVLAKTSQFSAVDDEDIPGEGASAYQGMLWMKNKYEQYQKQTDARHEQLKEKLRQSEKKVLELQASLEEEKAAIRAEGVMKDVMIKTETGETGTTGEKGTDLKEENRKLKEESRILRERISEKESIQDLMGEKDSQIAFLQNQLEQRIKNYHLVEYQGREDKNYIAQLQGQLTESLGKSTGLQGQTDGLQAEKNALTGQIADLQEQLIQSKVQVTELGDQSVKAGDLLAERQRMLDDREKSLNEGQLLLREKELITEGLNGAIDGLKIRVQELNGLLQQEKDKTKELTGKLEYNSRLLMGIYKELDRSLREEMETPIPALLERELESVDH